MEESGLTAMVLDPDPLLLSQHEVNCGNVRPTHHLDVQYLVTVNAATAPAITAESVDLQWFDVERLPPVDASVRDLVDAAKARLRW
jgi:hypothetical protein